jgi:hypothetical protein
MTSNKHADVDRPLVGGTVGKHRRFSQSVKVPVGVEKILYLAARDPDLRARLLADRAGTIAGLGVELRESERAMLAAAPVAALETMMERIDASNPRKRRFMNVVAAAATSLAAGTAAMSCVSCGGVGPDVDTDTNYGVDAGVGPDTDADTDADGSTDTEMDGSTDTDTADTDTNYGVDAGVGPDLDAGE